MDIDTSIPDDIELGDTLRFNPIGETIKTKWKELKEKGWEMVYEGGFWNRVIPYKMWTPGAVFWIGADKSIAMIYPDMGSHHQTKIEALTSPVPSMNWYGVLIKVGLHTGTSDPMKVHAEIKERYASRKEAMRDMVAYMKKYALEKSGERKSNPALPDVAGIEDMDDDDSKYLDEKTTVTTPVMNPEEDRYHPRCNTDGTFQIWNGTKWSGRMKHLNRKVRAKLTKKDAHLVRRHLSKRSNPKENNTVSKKKSAEKAEPKTEPAQAVPAADGQVPNVLPPEENPSKFTNRKCECGHADWEHSVKTDACEKCDCKAFKGTTKTNTPEENPPQIIMDAKAKFDTATQAVKGKAEEIVDKMKTTAEPVTKKLLKAKLYVVRVMKGEKEHLLVVKAASEDAAKKLGAKMKAVAVDAKSVSAYTLDEWLATTWEQWPNRLRLKRGINRSNMMKKWHALTKKAQKIARRNFLSRLPVFAKNPSGFADLEDEIAGPDEVDDDYDAAVEEEFRENPSEEVEGEAYDLPTAPPRNRVPPGYKIEENPNPQGPNVFACPKCGGQIYNTDKIAANPHGGKPFYLLACRDCNSKFKLKVS